MRWLWVFLVSSLAWGQSHEILRPTVDADGGSSVANAVLSQCSSSFLGGSSPVPNWYDSGGLSTSTTFDTGASSATAKCASRVVKTWQASGVGSYTSLTLNVNTSGTCSTSDCGVGQMAYSTDGGVTWNSISAQGGTSWTQQTSSVSLSASQDLTKLMVAGVNQANGNDVDHGDHSITGFDVWTDGIYTAPTPTPTPTPSTPPNPSVSQPSIVSRIFTWLNTSLFLF